ncbi:hypothetical protein ES332_D11G300000v1 [Gossypium tomentosum]|uniref:Uncharacterized protein n=1 Tax=Gossypium tomentosum TaxID=34277 RepID=A0A5D2IU76_GOSTO|nr:hypothetical protein ES332_D11G300000v1 [Gossypium tomentosum]
MEMNFCSTMSAVSRQVTNQGIRSEVQYVAVEIARDYMRMMVLSFL